MSGCPKCSWLDPGLTAAQAILECQNHKRGSSIQKEVTANGEKGFTFSKVYHLHRKKYSNQHVVGEEYQQGRRFQYRVGEEHQHGLRFYCY